MSHPTGDHESAAKLAAGYVEVNVKYAQGMEKIHKDFDDVEAHAKTTGAAAGASIVEAVSAAGAPAAQGFADKLAETGATATKEASGTVADAFKEGVVGALQDAGIQAGDGASKSVVGSFMDGVRQGFRESRIGDDIDYVFNGAKEKSAMGGEQAADGFMGRWIQVFKARSKDAEGAGSEAGEAVKSGIAKSLAGLDAAGIGAAMEKLRDQQLDSRRNVLALQQDYQRMSADSATSVDALTAKHKELSAAQQETKNGALDIATASNLYRSKSREEKEGGEGLGLGEKAKTASESVSTIGNTGKEALEGGLGAEGIMKIGPALAALANPATLAVGAVAGVGIATGVVLDKVYELGEKWEDTFHNLQITTGATGDKLHGLEESVKNVVGQVPLSMQQVGSIVGTVATSFKDTGAGVDQVATQVGKLQSMVGQVDLQALGKGFRGFGIGDNPQAQVDVLNQLFKATQATQLPINSLVDAMSRAAPIANQFHLSIGETTAVMSQFDAAGIDPSRTMFTLAKAAQEATKEHKDFTTVLKDQIDQIRNASTEQEKLDKAGEFFGKTSGRGGAAQIVQAIDQGLTLDPAVLAQIQNAAGLIDKTREQTMSWGDTWTELKGRISAALEPVSQELREHVQKGFEAIGDWIGEHTPQIVAFITSIVDGFETAGKYIAIGWNAAKTAVSAVIDYLTPAFQALAPHLAALGSSIMPFVSALVHEFGPGLKLFGEGVVVALGLIIRAIGPVVDGVTSIIHIGTDMSNWFTANIPPMWDAVFGAAKGVISPVVDAIESIWHAGEKVGDYLKDHVGPIIHTTFGIIADILRPGISAFVELLDGITKVGEYIGTTLGGILDGFGKVVGNIVTAVMDPFVDGWNKLWDIIKKVGDYLGGAFTTVLDSVSSALKDVKGWMDDVPGIGPDSDSPPAAPPRTGGHQYGGPIVHARKGIALNGYGGGDIVPAMLEPGEHVWTKEETEAVGGHKDMFLLRALAKHGQLKDLLGLAGYEEGGKVRPAGLAHKPEKSWVTDSYKLSEPGKVHFDTGGNVPPWVINGTETDQGKVLTGGDTGHPLLNPWMFNRDPNMPHVGPDNHDQKIEPPMIGNPNIGRLGIPGLDPDGEVIITPWSKMTFGTGGVVGYDQGGAAGDDPGDGNVGNLPAVKALLGAESGRTPYVFGGYSPKGIDCSGLVAEAVQVYLGEPMTMGAHPMSTANEAAWLSARGFKQGTGSDGDFRVSFYNGGEGGGHTALTLPDGTNAESGGSGGGVRLGGGAAGAGSSEFNEHWYLPAQSVVSPGGYGGTGSGGSGGYGGAGGSGSSSGSGGAGSASGSTGATQAQIDGANSKVTAQQGKLDVLNAKITEAQAAVDKAEGSKEGKGEKGAAAHEKRVADAQATLAKLKDEKDQATGDLDSITNERDNLTGDRDPKTLIAANDRITDATRRRDDAQAKLDRDQADSHTKQSTIIADQNELAKANDNIAKATQHLQDVQNKPAKKGKGESKEAQSTDFVDVIGKAGQDFLQGNLPQGFSDPTSWAGVKSAAALLKFGAGVAGHFGNKGAAGALTTFGDLLGGSGSGVAKDIATMVAGGTPGMAANVAAQGGAGQPVPDSVKDLVNQVPGYTPPSTPDLDSNNAGAQGDTYNIDRSAKYTGDITDMNSHQTAKNATDQRYVNRDIKQKRLIQT